MGKVFCAAIQSVISGDRQEILFATGMESLSVFADGTHVVYSARRGDKRPTCGYSPPIVTAHQSKFHQTTPMTTRRFP